MKCVTPGSNQICSLILNLCVGCFGEVGGMDYLSTRLSTFAPSVKFPH